MLQNIGEPVSPDQLHEILSEVDLNRNAQVDLGEYLQVGHLHRILLVLVFTFTNQFYRESVKRCLRMSFMRY